MSFFDQYKDVSGGGDFMKSPDKQFLIDNGIVFQIKALTHDPENQYGPRFIAFCLVPDEDSGEPTERKISFPTGSNVETRDNMLRAMEEYLDGEDAEPVYVKMTQPKQAILIQPAEEPAWAKKGR